MLVKLKSYRSRVQYILIKSNFEEEVNKVIKYVLTATNHFRRNIHPFIALSLGEVEGGAWCGQGVGR